ncbi:hypothetical protein AOLI_G00242320 [Acnodon oligacanthus]
MCETERSIAQLEAALKERQIQLRVEQRWLRERAPRDPEWSSAASRHKLGCWRRCVVSRTPCVCCVSVCVRPTRCSRRQLRIRVCWKRSSRAKLRHSTIDQHSCTELHKTYTNILQRLGHTQLTKPRYTRT